MARACEEVGLPGSCVEIVPITDRQAVLELVRLDQYLSLVVPRGGAQLIRTVKDNATVPVLEHERGMTQIYVDATCDLDMIEEVRRTWQFFRDRRPETYGPLVAL